MKRSHTSGILLAWCAGMTACWVPAGKGDQMQAEIRQLQSQQQQAQKGLDEARAALTDQMDRADKQIEEVASALTDLKRAAHNTDADFGVQLEKMIQELQELRGALELTDYRLAKLEAKIDGEGSLTTRLEALEKKAPEAPTASPAAAAEPKDKKELLLQARQLAKDGKTVEARGLYREIVKRWPDETGVTDEATYRLGELYFDEKKFKNAQQEYVKVAQKFASGKLVDDALYRLALCSIELGAYEDAQIFLGEIVKGHKDSPHAGSAKAKLEEVKAKIEKEKDKDGKGKKPGKK